MYTDCARKIGILRRLQRKLRSTALRKIFIGAIRPRLEYACPVWSVGNTSKLVKLQELFCRRHQIVLPQLQQRFDYHTLVLFFKIKSNLAPPYLTELLPQLSSHCGYNFRKNPYPVPAVKKSSTLTSFFPRSIILWNSLPSDIQSSTTLPKFKAVLGEYLKVPSPTRNYTHTHTHTRAHTECMHTSRTIRNAGTISMYLLFCNPVN